MIEFNKGLFGGYVLFGSNKKVAVKMHDRRTGKGKVRKKVRRHYRQLKN